MSFKESVEKVKETSQKLRSDVRETIETIRIKPVRRWIRRKIDEIRE